MDLPDPNLAPYAVRAADALHRRHPEPEHPLRGPFEVDRHRIIECTAFRRLEGKTQVFAPSHHDHFRTRLTHTLEAAQVARCLAAALRANEALTEVITLAHDLGHPPFGHAGEAALDEAMAPSGGFNHNRHSLRVVEYLEHPFPAFRGLNLTMETLAGLAGHATRYDAPHAANLDGTAAPSIEAQIASMADRIAYNCHDLEDAIGAGYVGLSELDRLPAWRDAFDRTTAGIDVPHVHAVRRIVLDAMLDTWLADVIETSRRYLVDVTSLDQVRAAERVSVALSPDGHSRIAELEQFLIEHVYQHSEVAMMDAKGRQMVLALFDRYRAEPTRLPPRFGRRIDEQGLDHVISDYIAGMTDRFCTIQHHRIMNR